MSTPFAEALSRRAFLTALAAPALAAESLPPIRPITKAPNFHRLGYYDNGPFLEKRHADNL